MPKCIYDNVHQEYICIDNKKKNIEYYTRESDTLFLKYDKFQILSTKQILFYGIFFFLLSYIILITIHECGHALVLTIYGIDIEVIETFPTIIFTHGLDFGGYVLPGADISSLSDSQHFLVLLAGSGTAFLCAVLLFGFSYLFKLSPRAELFAICFMIAGIFELVSYPITDFTTSFGGDWSEMYAIYPVVKPIILTLCVVIPIAFVIILKKTLFKRLTI